MIYLWTVSVGVREMLFIQLFQNCSFDNCVAWFNGFQAGGWFIHTAGSIITEMDCKRPCAGTMKNGLKNKVAGKRVR